MARNQDRVLPAGWAGPGTPAQLLTDVVASLAVGGGGSPIDLTGYALVDGSRPFTGVVEAPEFQDATNVKYHGAQVNGVTDDNVVVATLKAAGNIIYVPRGECLIDLATYQGLRSFGPGIFQVKCGASRVPLPAERIPLGFHPLSSDPYRPLYTVGDIVLAVPSGVPTIQQALDLIPVHRGHNVSILVADGDYTAEGVLILPTTVGSRRNIDPGREGNAISLTGNVATPANVKLYALYIEGGGHSNVFLNGLRFQGAVVGTDAISDDGGAVEVRPGAVLILRAVDFYNNTGVAQKSGVMAYGGQVEWKGPSVFGGAGSFYYEYIGKAKRLGQIYALLNDGNASGTVGLGAFRNEGSFICYDNSHVTALLPGGAGASATNFTNIAPIYAGIETSGIRTTAYGLNALRSFLYARYAGSDTPQFTAENDMLTLSGATGLDGTSGKALYLRDTGVWKRIPHGTRAAAITSPAADVAALKTAVDAIRAALTAFGITV